MRGDGREQAGPGGNGRRISDGERADAQRERREMSLGALLRLEAHRALSENALEPDPARVAEGWERRFVADGQRAEEAMALYRELGYEVCADPVRAEELGNECDACRLVALLRFQTIYTRRHEEHRLTPRPTGPPGLPDQIKPVAILTCAEPAPAASRRTHHSRESAARPPALGPE
ncbi:MAG TPA: hypothetical protein VJ957_03580 [Longimicrobiales bacterium]|nr:hypothetical protein [Longimicrobiales bacterium]